MSLLDLPRDVLERITDAVELEWLVRLALGNKALKALLAPVIRQRWDRLNRDADELWRAIRKGKETAVALDLNGLPEDTDVLWKAMGLVPEDAEWTRNPSDEPCTFRLGNVRMNQSSHGATYHGTLDIVPYTLFASGVSAYGPCGLNVGDNEWMIYSGPCHYTTDYAAIARSRVQHARDELSFLETAPLEVGRPPAEAYELAASGTGRAAIAASRGIIAYQSRKKLRAAEIEEAQRNVHCEEAYLARVLARQGPWGSVVAALNLALDRVWPGERP